MHRLAFGLLALVALAGPATAHPPPLERAYTPAPTITLIEWTTWLRGSAIVSRGEPDPTVVRAATTPVDDDRSVVGAAGLGFTLPMGQHARIGGWGEVRSWHTPLVGGELTLIPGELDLFQYRGKSAITARVGGNPSLVTAQLGLGYRAPWDLFGDQPRGSRYMIGVQLVTTLTQSRVDRGDWSATVGLEFEPVGALRYLLGVRSWYH